MNDLIRYNIYCQKAGKVSCESLPPCLNVLEQHIKRVNFQARKWKMCLELTVETGNPSENGWTVGDKGLSITWMTCNSAPDEVSRTYKSFEVYD